MGYNIMSLKFSTDSIKEIHEGVKFKQATSWKFVAKPLRLASQPQRISDELLETLESCLDRFEALGLSPLALIGTHLMSDNQEFLIPSFPFIKAS